MKNGGYRKWPSDTRRSSCSGCDTPGRPRVIRATRYAVKPMSVEDAALRVEGGPDTFVVFRNADSDSVSILYRRKDGHLGLIEPD